MNICLSAYDTANIWHDFDGGQFLSLTLGGLKWATYCIMTYSSLIRYEYAFSPISIKSIPRLILIELLIILDLKHSSY